MKKHLSHERRTEVPAYPTGRATLPAGTATCGGTLRIRYAQPDRPTSQPACPRRDEPVNPQSNQSTDQLNRRLTVQPKAQPANRRIGPMGGEGCESIGDVPVSPLTLTRSLRRQRKGSLPLPCGRVFPPLPHPRPDAWSASFDTGIWECPIVSTADHPSNLPALLPTHRANFGSDAPVQSDGAASAPHFASENCVFARSGIAQSAPPLLGGRGSKVISRVTRKSPGRIFGHLVTTLPLQGAPVWRSGSGASETRAADPSRSRWSRSGRPVLQASGRLPMVVPLRLAHNFFRSC